MAGGPQAGSRAGSSLGVRGLQRGQSPWRPLAAWGAPLAPGVLVGAEPGGWGRCSVPAPAARPLVSLAAAGRGVPASPAAPGRADHRQPARRTRALPSPSDPKKAQPEGPLQ